MPQQTGMPSWCRRRCRRRSWPQLNAILTKALKAQEVQAAYAQQGMETIASTEAEAAARVARETEVWKKVIADAGIRLE